MKENFKKKKFYKKLKIKNKKNKIFKKNMMN